MKDNEHARILEAAYIVLRADSMLRDALGVLEPVTRNEDVVRYIRNINDARLHLANQFCTAKEDIL